MKAGFIASFVEEQPDSEAFANLVANDFDFYRMMLLSGGYDSEVKEGLEIMYATCLTFAK